MRININKTYSIINVFGLATGLTGVLVISLFLHYEYNYDTWSPQLQQVYGVQALNNLSGSTGNDKWNDLADARVAFALRAQLPAVQKVTVMQPSYSRQLAMEGNGKYFMQQDVAGCDSNFFHVFPYHFVSGTSAAFAQPQSIVLTTQTALKLFNTVDAAGKTINIKYYEDDKARVYTVSGVIELPVSPSLLHFTAVRHETYMDKAPEYAGAHSPVKIFMLLKPNADIQQITQQAETIYNSTMDSWWSQMRKYNMSGIGKKYQHGIQLQSLRDAHIYPAGEKSLPEKMAPLAGLAVLLLVIAIINFTNLSVAQASFKAKEVVIRKISGAAAWQLIGRFLWQSAVKCIAAFILAAMFAWWLVPVFNSVFNVQVNTVNAINTGGFVLTAAIVLVATILLSGIYPAIYVTAYKPLKVLRGDIKRSPGGFTLRNLLVVLQFTIAVIFVTVLGVMNSQLGYMANADLGFTPGGLIHIDAAHNAAFAERVKNVPGVLYAGETSQRMGEEDNMKIKVFYDGDSAQVNFVGSDYGTMQAMHVKLASGRLFDKQHGADSINTIIINTAAAKMMGGEAVGKWIYLGSYKYKQQIVGVIDDYHYQGFDKEIGPAVYTVNGNYGVPDRNGILVNAGASSGAVLATVERLWNQYYPAYPFRYSFVEDDFNTLLVQYRRMQQVFNVFSIIAILLSLTGLFALTTYMVQQRIKEIGIRKVLGASINSILGKFNKSYLLLIALANIIAWPLALLAGRQWLNGFVYRISIPLLPFAIAAGVSLLLAAVTLSIQVWRAAIANPVNVLRQQ